MTDTKDGGPAHPITERTTHDDGQIVCQEWPGLSIRDYFAAKCLMGFFNGCSWTDDEMREDDDNFIFNDPKLTETLRNLSKLCYMAADAMLRAREEKK